MYVQLWDVETGNLLDYTATQDEMLDMIRATIAMHGRDAITPWAMLVIDDDEEMVSKAEGSALVELALSNAPA